jgi:hypothetical protein
MGTRNLTCVVIDGQFKVAQYCQWDGYPSGQGATVYKFCKTLKGVAATSSVRALEREAQEAPGDVAVRIKLSRAKERQGSTLDRFKRMVRAIGETTKQQVKTLWTECGADPKSDGVKLDVVERFREKYPHFDRNMGAKILEAVASGDVKSVLLDTDFAADSLFCEWAYVLDLDREVLEVYTGFQKTPHQKGRFANMPYEPEGHRKGKPQEYWPVALVREWPLAKLPRTADAFVKAATPKEDA